MPRFSSDARGSATVPYFYASGERLHSAVAVAETIRAVIVGSARVASGWPGSGADEAGAAGGVGGRDG